MLTGDKVETALNIGVCAGLFASNSTILNYDSEHLLGLQGLCNKEGLLT